MRRLMGTKSERGVSAVLVVISITAIFGAAILSVDAGQLWTARRNVVTATDASALAQGNYFAKLAAQTVTVPPTSCTAGVWDTILNKNVAGTFGNLCTVTSITGKSGVVIVQSHKTSPARFAGVLGLGDSAAFSMTAVKWGYVRPIGLRPIALCILDPHIADAIAPVETHIQNLPLGDYSAPDGSTDMAGRTPGTVHHIVFSPTCGTAPGNFGWLDLNYYEPGNNQDFPNKELSDWVHDGYYGNHVSLTPTSDCDYEVTPTQDCNGTTGVKNSSEVNDAMCFLVYQNDACTGAKNPQTVLIVLYNGGADNGSGATFHMVALAHVKIWKYKLDGSDRFLDLQFVTTTTEGICCSDIPPAGTGPALIGTKICDIDHHGDPNLALACA